MSVSERVYRRQYLCDRCYLLYSAVWAGDGPSGQEDCPACGEGHPHPLDTFGMAYWERGMGERHGAEFFFANYWCCPGACTKEELDGWTSRGYHLEPKLSKRPPALTLAGPDSARRAALDRHRAALPKAGP